MTLVRRMTSDDFFGAAWTPTEDDWWAVCNGVEQPAHYYRARQVWTQ